MGNMLLYGMLSLKSGLRIATYVMSCLFSAGFLWLVTNFTGIMNPEHNVSGAVIVKYVMEISILNLHFLLENISGRKWLPSSYLWFSYRMMLGNTPIPPSFPA